MKRLILILLAFVVVGATMSCEKESLNVNDAEKNSQLTGVDRVEEVVLGVWTLTLEYEDDKIYSHTDSALHFYKDKSGYNTSDTYGVDNRHIGLGRNPFTWYIEDDSIFIVYDEREPIEWYYIVDGDKLTMYYEDEEVSEKYVYTKVEGLDRRFNGDWSISRKSGDIYIDSHFQFVTERDGFKYQNEYNNPQSKPIDGPSYPIWFKYSYDDSNLTITFVDTKQSQTYAYSINGNNLILTNEKGDKECYTKIKK